MVMIGMEQNKFAKYFIFLDHIFSCTTGSVVNLVVLIDPWHCASCYPCCRWRTNHLKVVFVNVFPVLTKVRTLIVHTLIFISFFLFILKQITPKTEKCLSFLKLIFCEIVCGGVPRKVFRQINL